MTSTLISRPLHLKNLGGTGGWDAPFLLRASGRQPFPYRIMEGLPVIRPETAKLHSLVTPPSRVGECIGDLALTSVRLSP
jgi:hypothetical protein